MRDANLAISLAAFLEIDQTTELLGRIILAAAKSRLGVTTPLDGEVLVDARSADDGTLSAEWKLISGYFVVLDQIAKGEDGEAAERFARVVLLDETVHKTLRVDRQIEVARLRAKLETALAADPE